MKFSLLPVSALSLSLITIACGESGGESDNGSTASSTDCNPGSEGCVCASGEECLGDLTCASNTCVSISGGETGGDGDSSPGGDGDSSNPAGSGGNTSSGSGGQTGSGGTSGAAGGSTGQVGGDEERDNENSPIIISLLTNHAKMTPSPGGSVTFSAIISDPDGIGDVVGGQLLLKDGGLALSTFATSGEEGAYSATLTWPSMMAYGYRETPEQVHEIPLTVRFFDQSGNAVVREVVLDIDCPPTSALCPAGNNISYCQDLDTDVFSCGSCGNMCGNRQSEYYCAEGKCEGGCVELEDLPNEDYTCADYCSDRGKSCSELCGGTDYLTLHTGSVLFCDYPGDFDDGGAVAGTDCNSNIREAVLPRSPVMFNCCCVD